MRNRRPPVNNEWRSPELNGTSPTQRDVDRDAAWVSAPRLEAFRPASPRPKFATPRSRFGLGLKRIVHIPWIAGCRLPQRDDALWQTRWRTGVKMIPPRSAWNTRPLPNCNSLLFRCTQGEQVLNVNREFKGKGKSNPYSIAEPRVLIPVLCSQPAGGVSHKPGSMLPLLSTRPGVTLAALKRAATSFAAWWTEARWVRTVCLRLLPESVAAAIWTQALLHLSPAR